jgi:hypothetical protein
MKWKDTTTYIRDEVPRVPRAWTLALEGLNITVVKGHIYHPHTWIVHCHCLGIDTHPLSEAKTAEDAQRMAVAMVREKVNKWHKALKGLK